MLDVAAPVSVPSSDDFLENGVRRPNCLIAHRSHSIVVAGRALTADGDPQRLIDQHESRDVTVGADLAIRRHRVVGSAVGRIELDEDAIWLLAQHASQ